MDPRPRAKHDHLVAPDDAVPRRRPGARLTLCDCWRDFARRRSPRMIAGAIAGAALVRARYGPPRASDAKIGVGLVAAQPFVEWLIHVYLLHSRPLRVGGRRVDLPAAREHREHHAEPAQLDGVLVPTPVLAGFLPLIAVIAWILALPISRVAGGDRRAGAATGTLSAYLLLGAYEWSHYLIHTPYVPRGRVYGAIRRSHRLHHYKNERYWFGVTSNVGDRVLGTFPDQGGVPRSPTARALHAPAGSGGAEG
jgi:hypothetical protein